jgi:hypothetical protein
VNLDMRHARGCARNFDTARAGAVVATKTLGKDAPEPRPVQPPSMGTIVELQEVGGLHHRYIRQAA